MFKRLVACFYMIGPVAFVFLLASCSMILPEINFPTPTPTPPSYVQGGVGNSSPSTPTISSFSPSSGTTAGGTALTITGTNFVSGATVTLGPTACETVDVVSATEITCTTPAESAGAVTVAVVSNSTTATADSSFTFAAPVSPTFTNVNVILQANCVACHSNTNTAGGANFSSYSQTIATGGVIAGDPTDSNLYAQVVNGFMPPLGGSLTVDQITLIQTWILDGALNN